MHTSNHPKNRLNAIEKSVRIGTILLGISMASPSTGFAADEDLEQWEIDAKTPNIVVFGVGGVSVDGDEAQFLARENAGKDVFGGLEYLWFTNELKEGLIGEVEARAMYEIEDYLMRLRLTKEDVGFLEFGYKSFREWFDATGGYDPINDESIHFFDEQMFIDRDVLWIAGQYSNDEDTIFNFKYSRRTREGMKGSTAWADATLSNGDRKNIVPGFYNIDEERHTIEADLEHYGNKSDFNLGVVWETNKQYNSRNHRRMPDTSADRYVTQTEDFDTDLFNGHGAVGYKINDQLRFNVGSSYTTMDTILNGSRTINGEFSPVYDPNFQRQNRDHGFIDLDGKTNMKQWVVNANAEYLVTKDFQIIPSIRFENYDTDSYADVIETNSNGRPGGDSFEELQPFGNSYWDDISGQIDMIYRGVPNWVFSGTYYASHGEGDISEREIDVELAEVILERDSTRNQYQEKLSLSAKFYPQPGLNYILNYYHKTADNDWDHVLDPTASTGGDRLPAFFEDLNFTTDDVNFRISWRPTQKLSMVTRVDYQNSNTEMRGGSLQLIESAEMETKIFSQAFTFIPNQKYMIQASYNLVSDSLDTPANELTGVSPLLVPDTKNDYWQADLSLNCMLNEKQNVLFRLFRYESDGYLDNSQVTQPYGFTDEQTSFTITGKQKIDDLTTVSLQYGFYDLNEIAQGGQNNYQAHVVYCRWEKRF
jgi:hypothetical protein